VRKLNISQIHEMREDMNFMKKTLYFGMQQALCCIFPVAIFLTLALSKIIHIPFLHRYDFILLVCIFVQFLMVYFKLETLDELKVICMFHIIGLCLELYKVHMGSWAYPENAVAKFGGVPLYSGFMYASVASYICQAWKRLDLQFINWPNNYITYPVACLIYFNFFLHHFIIDLRWVIIVSLVIVFWKSKVIFKIDKQNYKMPLIISFFLIGFFIWFAENISTFFGAWKYPDQMKIWKLVHIGKISSWFLLVIISIIIVANLKHFKYREKQEPSELGIDVKG
jgi:uncharacterized membrane protein YoaT (DUF817 family)